MPRAVNDLAEPEWSPLLSVATEYVTSAERRRRSLSGGAIWSVLEHLLASGERPAACCRSQRARIRHG